VNILVVTAGVPRPTLGANTRNYHLLKALASRHAVSLLALVDDIAVLAHGDMSLQKDLARPIHLARVPSSSKRVQQALDLLPGRSYFLNRYRVREVQDTLDAMFKHDHYDVVLFESVFLAGYRLPEDVKVVIDQHNIEHELLLRAFSYEKARIRKWYNWLEGRLFKTGEIKRCCQADATLVTNDREHLLLKNMLPRQMIRTIPNGVDIAAFQSTMQEEIANQIVFTGTMDDYPNIDAVLSFARLCWPHIQAHIPGATWQIVGRNPPPEVQRLADLPGITVTGFVPDVRSYLATSALAIAPLQIGSGARLKILEAFAMRRAVVSTSIGCQGLSVVSGEHLMIADQPEDFALTVVELLRNPTKRMLLGCAGRVLVEDEYSWVHSGNKLLHALEHLF
jgi:sugar transferase (PEP-CTERM/EpsH1 system associated)